MSGSLSDEKQANGIPGGGNSSLQSTTEGETTAVIKENKQYQRQGDMSHSLAMKKYSWKMNKRMANLKCFSAFEV